LQQLLQRELVERCKKNPKYSLRSFARQLGVSASLLSRVLTGAREPSNQFSSKVAASLQWDPSVLKRINSRPNASHRLGEFRDLMVDQFEVLSDWIHYAIFELMETKDFQPNMKWMAARLGVSTYEVQMAIERLESLKLIRVDEKGFQKIVPDITTTSYEFSTVALRQLQRQFLEQAARAMDEVPMELRSQTTMTMAIDPRRIKEAKERIHKFRREMITFLQESQNLNEVYNLTIGFYPLTKKQMKTGEKK
jgi:uncharacterized protein (TIGR02147 family)